VLCTREEVNSGQFKEMLDKWILLSLEWSPGKRSKTAAAMVVLYKESLFTPNVLKLSLREVLGMVADIIIDIPKTFQYLAELFGASQLHFTQYSEYRRRINLVGALKLKSG